MSISEFRKKYQGFNEEQLLSFLKSPIALDEKAKIIAIILSNFSYKYESIKEEDLEHLLEEVNHILDVNSGFENKNTVLQRLKEVSGLLKEATPALNAKLILIQQAVQQNITRLYTNPEEDTRLRIQSLRTAFDFNLNNVTQHMSHILNNRNETAELRLTVAITLVFSAKSSEELAMRIESFLPFLSEKNGTFSFLLLRWLDSFLDKQKFKKLKKNLDDSFALVFQNAKTKSEAVMPLLNILMNRKPLPFYESWIIEKCFTPYALEERKLAVSTLAKYTTETAKLALKKVAETDKSPLLKISAQQTLDSINNYASVESREKQVDFKTVFTSEHLTEVNIKPELLFNFAQCPDSSNMRQSAETFLLKKMRDYDPESQNAFTETIAQKHMQAWNKLHQDILSKLLHTNNALLKQDLVMMLAALGDPRSASAIDSIQITTDQAFTLTCEFALWALRQRHEHLMNMLHILEEKSLLSQQKERIVSYLIFAMQSRPEIGKELGDQIAKALSQALDNKANKGFIFAIFDVLKYITKNEQQLLIEKMLKKTKNETALIKLKAYLAKHFLHSEYKAECLTLLENKLSTGEPFYINTEPHLDLFGVLSVVAPEDKGRVLNVIKAYLKTKPNLSLEPLLVLMEIDHADVPSLVFKYYQRTTYEAFDALWGIARSKQKELSEAFLKKLMSLDPYDVERISKNADFTADLEAYMLMHMEPDWLLHLKKVNCHGNTDLLNVLKKVATALREKYAIPEVPDSEKDRLITLIQQADRFYRLDSVVSEFSDEVISQALLEILEQHENVGNALAVIRERKLNALGGEVEKRLSKLLEIEQDYEIYAQSDIDEYLETLAITCCAEAKKYFGRFLNEEYGSADIKAHCIAGLANIQALEYAEILFTLLKSDLDDGGYYLYELFEALTVLNYRPLLDWVYLNFDMLLQHESELVVGLVETVLHLEENAHTAFGFLLSQAYPSHDREEALAVMDLHLYHNPELRPVVKSLEHSSNIDSSLLEKLEL